MHRMSTPKKTLVAEHLREALARGDYEPGERLPGEEDLALAGHHVHRVDQTMGLQELDAVGNPEVEAIVAPRTSSSPCERSGSGPWTSNTRWDSTLIAW